MTAGRAEPAFDCASSRSGATTTSDFASWRSSCSEQGQATRGWHHRLRDGERLLHRRNNRGSTKVSPHQWAEDHPLTCDDALFPVPAFRLFIPAASGNCDPRNMEFTRIAFTTYCVTDLERARRFYEGVLGLRMLGANNKMIDYSVGPDLFRIMESSRSLTVEAPEAAFGDGEQAFEPSHHTAFEVEDFNGLIEKLKAQGCKFVHAPEYRSSGFAMAAIADPDGNWLILQSKHPIKPIESPPVSGQATRYI